MPFLFISSLAILEDFLRKEPGILAEIKNLIYGCAFGAEADHLDGYLLCLEKNMRIDNDNLKTARL